MLALFFSVTTDVSNVSVQQQIQSQMINQLGQQVMYQQQSPVFQPPMGLQQVPVRISLIFLRFPVG